MLCVKIVTVVIDICVRFSRFRAQRCSCDTANVRVKISELREAVGIYGGTAAALDVNQPKLAARSPDRLLTLAL